MVKYSWRVIVLLETQKSSWLQFFVYIAFVKPHTLQMINEPHSTWLYKCKPWVCAARLKNTAIGGRELLEIGETMSNRKETCRQIFGTDHSTYYKKIQISHSKL